MGEQPATADMTEIRRESERELADIGLRG